MTNARKLPLSTNIFSIFRVNTFFLYMKWTPNTLVNITQQFRKKENMRQELIIKTNDYLLYARYLCSRDALGLKAATGRPSAARDDRVSCIQDYLLT